MSELYLMHFGAKGMHWGIRRWQNEDGSLTPEGRIHYGIGDNGSKRTEKKLNAFLEADKKYGHYRTKIQDKKVNKLYQKYDKSAGKDIKRAIKIGDNKTANSISAGRTFLKSMMDQEFFNESMDNAIKNANLKEGKEYTYNVTRNDKLGGITITVNDKRTEHFRVDDSLSKTYKKKFNKENKEAAKRLIDDGDKNVIGIKQPNGDILFIDKRMSDKYGPAVAEKKTKEIIDAYRSERKTKPTKDKEAKQLVDELLRDFDGDSEELEVLKELKNSYR